MTVLFAILLAVAAAPTVEAGQPMLSAPLRVGATALPHAELLRAVEPELKAQGVNLDIRVYQDYAQPNIDVARGTLDANFFQTEPYLWRWRAAHMQPLVVVGRVHVEPMGIYSKKLKDLNAVRDGGIVSLPQDPANLGRALFLMQHAGLLKLDERRGLDAVLTDVLENPHHLKFRLLSAERVIDQLGTADLVVLNGNFALEGKLKAEQALFREGPDSPFPNVVVAREQQAGDARITALVKALRGPTAHKLMAEKYGAAVVPAQ